MQSEWKGTEVWGGMQVLAGLPYNNPSLYQMPAGDAALSQRTQWVLAALTTAQASPAILSPQSHTLLQIRARCVAVCHSLWQDIVLHAARVVATDSVSPQIAACHMPSHVTELTACRYHSYPYVRPDISTVSPVLCFAQSKRGF